MRGSERYEATKQALNGFIIAAFLLVVCVLCLAVVTGNVPTLNDLRHKSDKHSGEKTILDFRNNHNIGKTCVQKAMAICDHAGEPFV